MRRVRVSYPTAKLTAAADQAAYVGSGEHKTYPSSAGRPVRRLDASKCDPRDHGDFSQLTEWLRNAIRSGSVGDWEGGFPRYVWTLRNGHYYEARLTNSVLGQYKGYPLTEDEAKALSWL